MRASGISRQDLSDLVYAPSSPIGNARIALFAFIAFTQSSCVNVPEIGYSIYRYTDTFKFKQITCLFFICCIIIRCRSRLAALCAIQHMPKSICCNRRSPLSFISSPCIGKTSGAIGFEMNISVCPAITPPSPCKSAEICSPSCQKPQESESVLSKVTLGKTSIPALFYVRDPSVNRHLQPLRLLIIPALGIHHDLLPLLKLVCPLPFGHELLIILLAA